MSSVPTGDLYMPPCDLSSLQLFRNLMSLDIFRCWTYYFLKARVRLKSPDRGLTSF